MISLLFLICVMKIKNIYCDCIGDIPDKFKVEIRSNKNLLLVNEKYYSLELIKKPLIKLVRSILCSSDPEENEVGAFSISFQKENELYKYLRTVTYTGRTLQETFYKENNLIYFIDHTDLKLENNFINKDLAKEKVSVFKAMCLYPDITYSEETLRELIDGVYIDDFSFRDRGRRDKKEEAEKLSTKIISNLGLNIKDVNYVTRTVTTDQGMSLRFSDTGSGASTLLNYLPGLLYSILSGGICILSGLDFCSRFHPLVLREILRVFNELAGKYDSQVIIPWYGSNEDYLISQGVISKENLVSLLGEAENLIIE